jgi:hypothetical protein
MRNKRLNCFPFIIHHCGLHHFFSFLSILLIPSLLKLLLPS